MASRIRVLDSSGKVSLGVKEGVVGKEADYHRHVSGFISYTHADETHSVPYAFPDTSGSGRVSRGDEVKFSLEVIPRTSYMRATNVTVTRSKRERQLAEQIQGMFDMGMPRSQGVVETIKGDFGFIRRVDAPDHIYFRVDDVIEKDTIIEVLPHVSI